MVEMRYNNKIGNELLILARLSASLVVSVGFAHNLDFYTRNRHNFGVSSHLPMSGFDISVK